MSDRELLELAAKAAGLVVQRSRLNDPACEDLLIQTRDDHELHLEGWNPLTDDGDALRIAIKLKMNVYAAAHNYVCVEVPPEGDEGPICIEEDTSIVDNIQACAATRRAIVRAAAELGRTK